jgi:hypothetical protein
MTLSISSNLRESFDFAKDGLVGYWGRWLALIIISCIPIVNFIASGYSVKIYRGGSRAPDLDDVALMFIDGLKIVIIVLGYLIIPLILIIAPLFFMDPSSMAGIVVILIGAILSIALGLISIMGCIRFAKTDSIGEAFNFGEITARIGEIGWGSYILACLAFIILVGLVVGILSAIPIIGWLITVLITPFIGIWQAKYFENIYSLA